MNTGFFKFCIIAVVSFCYSCGEMGGGSANPPADGFNEAESDPKAIEIADEVMQAMGGRDSWDDTRYLSWNFFGIRHLVWDKKNGDVRIEVPGDSLELIVNIDSGDGMVKKDGELLNNADSLKKYLQMGKNIWINDSYWLVMPFKLKDSGVTLKYAGEEITAAGDSAEVLVLTFENVGETPQNKYHVFVDKQTKLVSQWAYFAEASQESPNFVIPWLDYEQKGKILLSGNRGERQLSDIRVLESVPDDTFTSLEPLNL